MKFSLLALPLMTMCVLLPALARAGDFTDDGSEDLGPRDHDFVAVSGAVRLRGYDFYDLSLNRGLTPSGQSFFPTSVSDPKALNLYYGDARLRTDLAAYLPSGSLALKARVDVIDGQGFVDAPPDFSPDNGGVAVGRAGIRVRRLYAEWLTPVGLVSAGRMSSTWAMGMLVNGGDGPDANLGDAADRIALVTPIAGMLWAVAYDHSIVDADTIRYAPDNAPIAFDASQGLQSVSFATMHWTGDLARHRRSNAGKTTFDYGAVFTYSWEQNGVDEVYGAAGNGTNRTLPLGFTSDTVDGWIRLSGPWGRIEAEGAYLDGEVRQASLIPGVLLHQPITLRQSGAALESEFGGETLSAGLDGGYASGDPAPGFGAFPVPGAPTPVPGDLDGPVASFPNHPQVDNFRFDPEYRIDRILFHEIIGLVTNAVYLRPHLRAELLAAAGGKLVASVAAIGSRAIYASSTPGQKAPLGIEVDPTLAWESARGLAVSLDHAVLFPLAGLDNPQQGLTAKPAQLLLLRVLFRF